MNLLYEILADLPATLKANRKVCEKQNDSNSSYDACELSSLDRAGPIVEEGWKESLKRRSKIEDKAKSTLTSVSISISVVFASLTLLARQVSEGEINVVGIYLLYGISVLIACYNATAALASLKAIEFGPEYGPSILTQINWGGSWSREQLIELMRCKVLNDYSSTIKVNWAIVANKCQRNGIILLVVLIVLGGPILALNNKSVSTSDLKLDGREASSVASESSGPTVKD